MEVDWPEVVVPGTADHEPDDVDEDEDAEVDADPEDVVRVAVERDDVARDVVRAVFVAGDVLACTAPTAMPVAGPRNAATLITPAAARDRAAAWRRFGLKASRVAAWR